MTTLFKLQWNPVNTDTKGTCQSVSVIWCPLRKKTFWTHFIDIKTKPGIFTEAKRKLLSDKFKLRIKPYANLS